MICVVSNEVANSQSRTKKRGKVATKQTRNYTWF